MSKHVQSEIIIYRMFALRETVFHNTIEYKTYINDAPMRGKNDNPIKLNNNLNLVLKINFIIFHLYNYTLKSFNIICHFFFFQYHFLYYFTIFLLLQIILWHCKKRITDMIWKKANLVFLLSVLLQVILVVSKNVIRSD